VIIISANFTVQSSDLFHLHDARVHGAST
jgi:hypothetical protein